MIAATAGSLPKLAAIAPFRAIGFYDFYKTKACIFKGAKKNAQFTKELPTSPTTPHILIGLFYHDIMEAIGTTETVGDLSKTIENLIIGYADQARKLSTLKKAGNFANWPEVNFAARKALEAFKRKKSTPVEQRQSEQKLTSRCGLFVGKPDLVLIHQRTAQLIEFKSNDIRESSGDLKAEYKEQLFFYSFLLFQNHQLDKIEATIESMSNDRIDLVIAPDASEAYYLEAKALLERANALVSSVAVGLDTSTISSPKSDVCWNCEKRLVCTIFKSKQLQIELSGDVFIVEGKVLAKETKAPNADTIIIFDSNLHREIRVKCDKSISPQIPINSQCALSELKRTALGFETTMKTEVFIE